MTKKLLVQFFWDCGRMGDVDGIFVTTQEELDKAYGKEVYFGEILGKHSEVYGTLEEKDITVLSDDQEFITKFVEIVGENPSGYNPLDYIQFDEEEEEEEEDETN